MKEILQKLLFKMGKEAPGPPERMNNWEADKIIRQKINVKLLSKKLKTDFRDQQEKVVAALARLVLELKPNISQYETIISDESSGRLPSLFLENIIDKKREELDKPPIRVFPVAGGRHHNYRKFSAIENFIKNKKEQMGKTLLVTEYIATGNSIKRLINILEKQGVDFDIAAVSINKNPEKMPGYYDTGLISRLKYGTASDSSRGSGLAFYGQKFTGVRKDLSTLSVQPVKDAISDAKEVAQARKDMDVLAEEMYKLLD